MKVDLGPVQPDSLPQMRGSFYVREFRGRTIAQAWPKKRTKPYSKAEIDHQRRFGFAAKMAATPYPVDYQTAVEFAKGTEQVPRDILTTAALGRYFTFSGPDGQEWTHVEGSTVNQTTQEDEFVYQWSQWDDAWSGTIDTAGYAFKGTTLTPRIELNVREVTLNFDLDLNAEYMFVMGTRDGSSNIESIQRSSLVAATAQGRQNIVFPFEINLKANQEYFYLIGRTDSTANFALRNPIFSTGHWHIPMTTGTHVRVVTLNPQIGDNLNPIGAGTNAIGFKV